MKLGRFLAEAGIELRKTTILLHSPREPHMRRVLPWIAESRPEVFDRYQNNHGSAVESTVKSRPYLLSFVENGQGRYVVENLYAVAGYGVWGRERILRDPAFQELIELMARTPQEASEAFDILEQRAIFDLRRDDRMAAYRGRLMIARPPGRAYARLSENLDVPILALTEESVLAAAPPNWRDWTITAAEIRAIPPSWSERLREWRGVYLIVDETDGARYVGSAYGEQNLLARWQAHVAGVRGLTRGLASRDPMRFRFSILERVSPDLPPEEVIAHENTWKLRLHTREFGLNDN